MSTLFKSGFRNLLRIIIVPSRFVSKDIRKQMNPKMVDYFQNMGLSQVQIKRLIYNNYKLKTATPSNVEEIFQLLELHNVDRQTAISRYPSILNRKPSAMREYPNVLEECGFQQIKPEYLISYFTIFKFRTIRDLKKDSILSEDLNVYNKLCECFKLWTLEDYKSNISQDETLTLFSLRLEVLRRYLAWRLDISKERFDHIIKTYNRFYHRPLGDMEESINIAERELKMPIERIVQNPFVISADPVNTMNIINRVKKFHGIDAREALYRLTLLIKEDYRHLMKVNRILQIYDIPSNYENRVLKLYVYKPKQLEKRLRTFKQLPDVNVFSTNRRFPTLVEFHKHVLPNVAQMKKDNLKCLGLFRLTINNSASRDSLYLGDKYPPGDIVHTIYSHLKCDGLSSVKELKQNLSKHLFYRNVSLVKITENINSLRGMFSREDISSNCHVLLYSLDNINRHLHLLLKLRTEHSDEMNRTDSTFIANQHKFISNYEGNSKDVLDAPDKQRLVTELKCIDTTNLSDHQILSLITYFIERKFNFSCSGIWDQESFDQ